MSAKAIRFKLLTIETPAGGRITARQYVARVQRLAVGFRGAHACEHGHVECAAWADGPCSNQIAAEHGLMDEHED